MGASIFVQTFGSIWFNDKIVFATTIHVEQSVFPLCFILYRMQEIVHFLTANETVHMNKHAVLCFIRVFAHIRNDRHSVYISDEIVSEYTMHEHWRHMVGYRRNVKGPGVRLRIT